MSDDNPAPPEPEQPVPPPVPKPDSASDEVRSTSSTLSEEELNKYLKSAEGKETSSLPQVQNLVVNYIDQRSGGVFFQGNANIGGDVVGRDQVSHKGRTSENREKAAVGQVLLNDIKKIRAVYVEPESYKAVETRLRERHLVILHGQAHTGKWTTAVRLLDSIHQGNIVELDPAAKSEQITESITTSRGYVVDTMSAETTEQLTPFFLSRLSETLRDKNAHLIITLEERNVISTEISKSHVVEWEIKVPSPKVLKNHLVWYASDVSEEKRNKIQNEQDVQTLLETALLPGEIDRLAELLADALHQKIDLAAALARFSSHAREIVKNWFEEHDDLDDRLFMLSVAVFNGASFQAVVDAEKKLHSLFPADDKPASASAIFGSSRNQRVRRVGARLKQGYARNEIGRVPVEVIEFDNPSIQPAVLQFAWDEYDRLREIITDWLDKSVMDSPFDERMRAAAAVGELSKYDFNEIRGKLILPWANHADSSVRTAASMALGIPAWDSETAPLVLKLLHHWSTLTNNWRLCWTACAAYGGLVGWKFLDAALRDLHQILKVGDLRLLGVLSRSIKSLFDLGEMVPEYRQAVLDALSEWSEKPKTVEGIFSLIIFLHIAETSKREADPEGDDWPILLWYAGKKDALANQIGALWAKAFNTKASRRVARSVFEDWLKIVQKDMRLQDGCIYLAQQIAEGESSGKEGRLIAYLTDWMENPDTEEIADIIYDHI